ncbi:MAPEG family protein [Pseudoalteromonas sp. G4]|uniref:MAPEG family protein n=1 Tax=Pseudoalteromonas sp. G4 TaxID=2992761 RepID=UPI00237E1424|nr:MAPEG family protein [Pseudoalteromonas sp. G4]MDE3270589.1 MAPEG family protein [Pseudoalteromonas sp. G4]
MNTLILCAIIAALLPYLAKAPVAIAMNKQGGYDNRHPRAQQSKLTGFGARALAAHQNSFESLLIFTIALVVVFATNTITSTTETLAIIYIIARVLYCVCYYVNWHILRSSVWLVGLICPIAMMFLSLN